MTLKIVGAGLPRTGTMSLKAALEQLLGGPCYHGSVVFSQDSHVDSWNAAGAGAPVDWRILFDGFHATVDWPGAAFWEELAEEFPESIILLSTRDSAEAWWKSASETIFSYAAGPDGPPILAMYAPLLEARFTTAIDDPEKAIAAYERHNAHVRATAPRGRLVEWTPKDGWGPLCEALGVPVPDDPFPRVNTAEDWARMAGAPDAIAAAGIEFAAVVEELMPHVREDTPVDDPRVRVLVDRLEAVDAVFHGGDEKMKAATRKMWEDNREELGRQLSRTMDQMDAVFRYLERAR